MLRWTLRTLALCAIVLTALNLAYVQRDDLVVIARLALNLAPPEAVPDGLPGGRPPFDARA